MADTKRLHWINCAKFIAMLAVVFDHGYSLMVAREAFRPVLYFSVSAFFFLSGCGARLSHLRNGRTSAKTTLLRLRRLLVPYAVATAVYVYIELQYIPLSHYLDRLIWFNADMAMYFVPILLQMTLFAPVLNAFLSKFESLRFSPVWIAGSVIAVIFLAQFSAERFAMYEFLASGALFGGRFLIPYYLGMVFARALAEKTERRVLLPLTVCSGVFAVAFGWFMAKFYYAFTLGEFPLWDRNPPGLLVILYTLAAVFFMRNLFLLLDGSRFVSFLSRLGGYTVDIYLYHQVFLRQGEALLFLTGFYTVFSRVSVGVLAVLLPILLRLLYRAAVRFFAPKTSGSAP